jgi:hypothetical protein
LPGANEIDNEQNERLKTHKETQQLVTANFESFDRDIYAFAETICEFCSKRCYPNQSAKLNLSNCGFPSYLPQELKAKDVSVLCHRCKTHINNKKETDFYQIDAMTIQYTAKFSCGTGERQMLPLFLCVHGSSQLEIDTICT